ncbi:hypothetical protein QAD02_017336 [Eretmocerus hayati]|uniref:Uncharacterized protein n=1 Tax=Eretmocerus hayati TaxID=131215 RepID=A0ACC2PG52_9HYME|nr:hypothetical protein QAD02_017336 [Eretmocerus hayati]
MEKDFRLFIKNLPAGTSESDVRDSICKYINIKSIDLKEKKNFKEETNRFAFIYVTSTDRELQECFKNLQKEKINGSLIQIELAKESFLDRLKKEREENQLRKDKPVISHEANNILNSKDGHAQNKRKVFSDSELTADNPVITETHSGRNHDEQHTRHSYNQPHISEGSQLISHAEDHIKKTGVKRKKPLQKLVIESCIGAAKVGTKESHITPNIQCSVVGESEKKRIDSLRQKKLAYKMQEKIIRNALMDSGKGNNKIIFDDEMDHQMVDTKKQDNTAPKHSLFGSDNEDDCSLQWDEAELEEKANMREKIMKLQTRTGNDERFKIDHRFIDDDEDNVTKQKTNDVTHDDLANEKEWQLNILGNILGKPVTSKTSCNEGMDQKRQKKVMVRYDPTASDHENYEVNLEESEKKESKKKKKKLSQTEILEDVVTVPTSNELFFDVSDKLVDSLKQTEGFSLLEAFGQKSQNTGSGGDVNDEASGNKKAFQFNFSKNPFHYDSSNDESDDDHEQSILKSNETETGVIQLKDDRFFFEANDNRFREAEAFFKNQSTCAEEDFKTRRRELKQIVRSKIRNNLRKKAPWTKKKIRKVRKQ